MNQLVVKEEWEAECRLVFCVLLVKKNGKALCTHVWPNQYDRHETIENNHPSLFAYTHTHTEEKREFVARGRITPIVQEYRLLWRESILYLQSRLLCHRILVIELCHRLEHWPPHEYHPRWGEKNILVLIPVRGRMYLLFQTLANSDDRCIEYFTESLFWDMNATFAFGCSCETFDKNSIEQGNNTFDCWRGLKTRTARSMKKSRSMLIFLTMCRIEICFSSLVLQVI